MMMDWVSPARGRATAQSMEAVRIGPEGQGVSGVTECWPELVALAHLLMLAPLPITVAHVELTTPSGHTRA